MKIKITMRRRAPFRWLVWILCVLMATAGIVPGAFSGEICGPVDLADVPLELIGGINVPGLLMISLDNSYSMGSEIMTEEPGDDPDTARLFNYGGKRYGYMFSGSPLPQSPGMEVLEADPVHKNAWKSQWHKYNKMYYNPFVGQDNGYAPWPTKLDVNVDNPRWDPQDSYDSTSTYSLTGDWLTGYVAIDSDPPAGGAATIFMDDQDAGFIKGGSAAWTESSTGHDGHSWYSTGGNGHTFTAEWEKKIEDTTQAYNIFVYRYYAQDPATYTVYDDASSMGSFTAPKDTGDQWVEIATDKKFSSGNAIIKLSGTGKNKAWNSADAIKLVPAGSGAAGTLYWDTSSSKTIKNRHFYVRSDNGETYLVNLISKDNAEFYLLDEIDWLNGVAVNDRLDWYEQDSKGGYPELVSRTYAQLPSDLKTANGGPLPLPGAGAYETHLQNFANWFTYYRYRRASAQNAVGVMVTEMKNMLVGLTLSPPTEKYGVRWINPSSNWEAAEDQTAEFLSILYDLHKYGSSTGFSSDIAILGNYFENQGGTISSDSGIITGTGYADDNTYPYFTQVNGGNCQQAFALLITDGASPSTDNIVNADGDNNSDYDGGVFGDDFVKTAADAAMLYYERDIKGEGNKGTLTDDVPTNYIDFAPHQHMVTYGLSFGADGPLREAYPDFDALCADSDDGNKCICDDGCPTWTDPVPPKGTGDPLDDLWHATVNGRGLFLYADNPQELVSKLREISADIERRKGSAAAVTTNSVQRQIGTSLYQGLYHSETWWGDLLAWEVDSISGALIRSTWSAQEELAEISYKDRKIFTYNGISAVNFLDADPDDFGLTASEAAYIAGDQTNEGPKAPDFRERLYVLGDIVHSEPFYFDHVIYVGANDGMMHAFDADNGKELFAYIPSMVHGNLKQLTEHAFIDDHRYYVNASPYAEEVKGVRYLAGGLGKGGKGVYCLTVDKAKNDGITANDILNWELDASLDDNMGYVYGRAYVANTNADKAVVIFGNGYASVNKKSGLYVVEASTGNALKVFDTGVTGIGGCNGMSSPALIDVNFDSKVDYVYAGDLDGNLWKFDLTDKDPNNWAMAYGGSPMFTARDSDGNPQAITSEPDVMEHCIKGRDGYVVVVGTGRYLNADDLVSRMSRNAMYGLYDWEPDWPEDQVAPPLGTFDGAGNLTVDQTLLKQSYVSTSGDFDLTTDFAIDYYNPETDTGEHAGWYFPFPDITEIMVRDPLLRNNVVYFVTNTQAGGICSSEGASYVNALNACSGGQPDKQEFDTDGDGDIDKDDVIKDQNPSRQYFDTTLFDPVLLEDILYINDTEGNVEEQEISGYPPGTSFWMMNE